ncbi:MAG: UvrD-helicase domain-containing protein [Myxococcota bacterium]
MSIAPRVAISQSFLTALAQLPRTTQKKVREFTAKFHENPTSNAINYESLQSIRDPKVRTVRIDLSYRAVVVHPSTGNLYMLVWVDHHDDAMAWARNKTFDVNAATGAIQVLDMEVVERARDDAPAAPAASGLFTFLTNKELAKTGLPEVLLPAVRSVETDADLEALEPFIPSEAYEALFFIACGMELDVAIRESSRPNKTAPETIDTENFEAALRAPASRRQFRLIESEDELLEMLDASLERWRVFLHPNQEAIVRTHFRGPARVLGGAGTGKTVVAMHRARYLARLYPRDRILFTTFNRNLASNISELIDGFCGAERSRIEVTNIHSWAVGYGGKRWGSVDIANSQKLDACWLEAVGAGRTELDWTELDYRIEWKEVIQFYGVGSLDEYLKASRAGSKKRLTRAERVQIWKGLAAFRAALDSRDLLEWNDVIRRVRISIEDDDAHPYRAIVVDEAQDLSAEEWRLLRALAPQQDNSLFITGDAHQRIYGRPVALSQFGINIRGRSRRLKINYRTTEQVLRWATALLDGVPIDDMDGGADTTVGHRSLYRGPPPELVELKSLTAQADFLVERVRSFLDSGAQGEEIAVVAKFKNQVNDFARFLSDAGIPVSVLDKDGAGAPGVRVSTMHRVKGLDFTHVIMSLPAHIADSTDPRDRSLLYVAATRCRKTLTVIR